MLAKLTGKSGGVEDLNIAEYPGPPGIHDPAQITKNIESELIGRIVTGLTRGSGEAAAADAARERVDEGVYPKEFAGAPDDLVRILSSPDILHIVVCGDAHRNRLMVMEGGHTQPTTKAIALPRNWERLLQE